MDPNESPPIQFRHVVAMPYPGRGHINPMMNLCKRLVRRYPNLHVTFVVTEEWLGFIGSNPKPDRIHFATLPNLIPSELVRAKDFIGFIDAVYTRLEEPFEKLLDGLNSPPPSAIIADTYVIWAVRVGRRRNIPVVSLWTMSATILSFFLHSDLLISHGHALFEPSESKEEEVVDYVPGLPPTKLRDLPPIFDGYSHRVFKTAKLCFDELPGAKCLLFTTAYELEPKAVDAFSSKLDIPVYATGPLIPFEELSVQNDNKEPDYIRWLDEQPESSVLYISQGSFLSVSEAQMEEIVKGVRESGVRFLWVARGGESKLKETLEGSSGVVVSWCDQLRVLCHAAVGGFWTHCGFNSTLEGIYSGVPMLAFPLFWDQILNAKMIFLNAKMIVEEWRVGMRIESKKQMELLIVSDEIKELVKRFMDGESEEGKEMRRRTCDLSGICRRAVAETGSSDANIDAFLKDITKIV
ncbi:UDP-glycosyltransferase 87A2 isoform X2 [Arabidopsis lyrata subsp. lyrata]|uniref:UDP-glycosyltransferase 87A2 isoform X2 n=1 Tax=Arabidopsis lyrata subsp. lyrata TaxID=81972 RepID=UPI000A29E4E2|nr:UDP-glycosyltransferase 87A2 isoform X2 [Arabidopsis lyrata subsp. lyrata]|eukprot:XP_020884862.1 UDP-glycosyltransferase 87A2 isoform X2 [Arabidopsis lyrata subsp. lyrata]